MAANTMWLKAHGVYTASQLALAKAGVSAGGSTWLSFSRSGDRRNGLIRWLAGWQWLSYCGRK